MNQETVNSLLRTLLSLAGAFIAGKGLKFFGIVIDGAYWQEIVGIVLGIVSAVWGLINKQVDREKTESVIKSTLTFVLSIFATKNLLDANQITAILTAVAAILPFIWSWSNKKKNEDISKMKTPVSALAKTTKLIAVLMLIGAVANAQSLVKKIYIKPPVEYTKSLRTLMPGQSASALPLSISLDTTFGALRPFTGVAYSFPNNQAQGIAGIGWQNITYTYATNTKPETKNVNWSVNAILTLGATTTKDIRETSGLSFGGLVGALNNSFMVGVVWNKGKKLPSDPTEKEKYLPQAIICYGINLN